MAASHWLVVVLALGLCAGLAALALREFLSITPVAAPQCRDDRALRGKNGGEVQGQLVVAAAGVVLLLSWSANMALWARPLCKTVCGLPGLSRWVAGLRRPTADDPETEGVRREYAKLRVQFARHVCRVLNCALMPTGLLMSIVLLSSFSQGPSSGWWQGMGAAEWNARMLRDRGVPVFALVSVILTAFSAMPQLLKSKVSDGSLVVLSFVVMWWTCSTSTCNLGWLQARALMIRTFQAMVCSDELLLTGMIGFAFVTDVAVRHKHGVMYHGPVGDGAADFSHAALIIGLGWMIRNVLWLEAGAVVETRRCCGANALVHRLLDSMCDAVVLLGEDFAVSRPSPKLAGLLLHRSLPAQSFTNLLHPDDCERFREHLAREAGQAQLEEALPAVVLHVRLRDGNGSNVPVQLFCSCIPDANTGRLQYMVGVKEEGLRCENDGFASPAEPAESLVIQHAIPETSSSLGSDDVSDVSVQAHDVGEMCAWVDPLDIDMRVLQHTPAFKTLSGTLAAGMELEPWFGGECEFLRSYQVAVNEWAAGTGVESSFTVTDVTLCPPQLKPFNLCLKGTVSCSFDDVVEGAPMRLSFSDVRAKPTSSRRQWVGTPHVGAARGRLGANRPSGEGAAESKRQPCRL